MPVTLPENASDAWSSIVVPNPLEPGTMATGTPLKTTLGRFATRTRWARDVLLRENGNPGVFRERIVTSTAFLRVITEHVTGDFCWVRVGSTGAKKYVYSETNTEADDDDLIIRPANISDDPPTTPGRWVDVTRCRHGSNRRLLVKYGLSVTGEASFDSDITAAASLTVGQLLIALGAITGTSDITASGSINAGGVLGCTGDAGIGGDCLVIGKMYAFNGLEVGTDLTPKSAKITGNANVTGAVVATAATLGGGAFIITASALTADKPINCTGEGRLRQRVLTLSADTNATTNANEADLVYLPDGVLTAGRYLTLADTGAGEGDTIGVFSEENGHTLLIRNAALSVIGAVGQGAAFRSDFTFIGGEWRRSS
jgi:hypothetical protein